MNVWSILLGSISSFIEISNGKRELEEMQKRHKIEKSEFCKEFGFEEVPVVEYQSAEDQTEADSYFQNKLVYESEENNFPEGITNFENENVNHEIFLSHEKITDSIYEDNVMTRNFKFEDFDGYPDCHKDDWPDGCVLSDEELVKLWWDREDYPDLDEW